MEKVAAKFKVGKLDNAFMGLFVVRRRESRMIERESMATGFASNECGIEELLLFRLMTPACIESQCRSGRHSCSEIYSENERWVSALGCQ